MTAVASPTAFHLALMPAAASPPRPAGATSPASSSHHHHHGSSALDDDDLLSLGAFKLESQRDQELLCLQSFLKGVLPAAAAGGSTAHPPALNSGLTLANAASASSAWANGWKAPAEGVAVPYGSPMSFASTASVGGPLGSSLSQSASAFPQHQSPFSSNHQQQHAYPSPQSFAQQPAVGSPLGGGAARGTWAAASPGHRAPACSRERVPTLSGFAAQGGAPQGGGAGAGAVSAAVDDGWKSRLRSSTRRAAQDQQYQARSSHTQRDDDDDAMME